MIMKPDSISLLVCLCHCVFRSAFMKQCATLVISLRLKLHVDVSEYMLGIISHLYISLKLFLGLLL